MQSRSWLIAVAIALVAGVTVRGQSPVAERSETPEPVRGEKPTEIPRVFYTKAGQFEIITLDASSAQQALALGREVWGALAVPLALPAEGFSSPVSVRLMPAEAWTAEAVFTVTAEAPGRVIVRVRWAADVDPLIVRRAFVQGLILRQAVAWHGVGAQLTVPLWLEQACTAWTLVRERPAMIDSMQQESIGRIPPPLSPLLHWERGAVDSRVWEVSSLWLFLQLQAEMDGRRWLPWLRGVLGGLDPVDSLPRNYQGLWANALAMELWWQTIFQHQRRIRALPVMTAVESRAWMSDRSRWLAGREGREVVLPLGELITLRSEPWVLAELKKRALQTRETLGVLHPYYSNAALSMGRLYEAAAKGSARDFKTALADFERDALDGRELEDTINAVLDTAPRK